MDLNPLFAKVLSQKKKLGHDHKYVRRASIVANECRIHIDFSFTLQFFLRKKVPGQEIMIMRYV